MGIIQAIVLFVRAFIMGRAAAAVENLALRQQEHSRADVLGPGLGKRDCGRFLGCHDVFQGVLIEALDSTLTTIQAAG